MGVALLCCRAGHDFALFLQVVASVHVVVVASLFSADSGLGPIAAKPALLCFRAFSRAGNVRAYTSNMYADLTPRPDTSHHVVFCPVGSCHARAGRGRQHHATPRSVMSRHVNHQVKPSQVMSSHVTLCQAASHHGTSHDDMPHYCGTLMQQLMTCACCTYSLSN